LEIVRQFILKEVFDAHLKADFFDTGFTHKSSDWFLKPNSITFFYVY